ncbi:UNVERIFIED_CONTAM: hypothetical protein Sradi_0065200 [Sesamum radiatum]|uniref:Uncharacterized protein n=1 Tax=Sesamum radiatum TaxID=300843 RepID=A0AAW2WIB0_SESRA
MGAVLLLMLEVSALLWQGNEVGEDHPTKADVIKRVNGAGLDVLGMVIIQTTLDAVLEVIDGEHGLKVGRQFLHLHALYLVVEGPHRHFRFLSLLMMKSDLEP